MAIFCVCKILIKLKESLFFLFFSSSLNSINLVFFLFFSFYFLFDHDSFNSYTVLRLWTTGKRGWGWARGTGA